MADENPSVPPKVNPLGARPSTLKLKPVIRPNAGGLKTGLKLPPKPGAAAPAPAPAAPAASAPAAPETSSLDQLKSVTQNLKSVTAPIPQQAILHKTGIIADPGLTEAQMAAAKARTSRISLSDAMGVAPVANEPAPMKTIRIKRPTDIPGATDPQAPAAAAAPAEEASDATNVTQRKTLKISRPGGAVRPSGKFTVKKQSAAPESAEPEVADIPDLPADSAFVPANGKLAAAAGVSRGDVEKDVSKGVSIMSIIIQSAACVAMALLVYKFYVDIYEISPF